MLPWYWNYKVIATGRIIVSSYILRTRSITLRTIGRSICWDRKTSGRECSTPGLNVTRRKKESFTQILLQYSSNTEFPASPQGLLRICQMSSRSQTERTVQENMCYYTTDHKTDTWELLTANSKAQNNGNSFEMALDPIQIQCKQAGSNQRYSSSMKLSNALARVVSCLNVLGNARQSRQRMMELRFDSSL